MPPAVEEPQSSESDRRCQLSGERISDIMEPAFDKEQRNLFKLCKVDRIGLEGKGPDSGDKTGC